MSPVLKVLITSPSTAGTLILLILAGLFISLSSGQSPPIFQSVSGEFAQKWIEDYKKNTHDAKSPM